MTKWLTGLLAASAVVGCIFWFSIDANLRYLILHPPESNNILFWTTEQRDAGFRTIEKLEPVTTHIIKKGNSSQPLQQGAPLPIDNSVIQAHMQKQRIAAIVVLHNGQIRLEEYGLDFSAEGKWTSFSVAKSLTSTLVGAALKDGAISSLDDKVSKYIPDMQGSAYDDVTVEQLLTMTSGIAWNEDYSDPSSDVSKFNFHVAAEGVDVTASYMRTLERGTQPGSKWLYSTGETNLIGLLVSQATGENLSTYLSQKIWSKIGTEQDASWILGATGHEIAGCCIQASTRDYARFGHFILEGAIVDGTSIVPSNWLEKATTKQADIGREGRGYGYQWWTSDDGSFQGRGIFGQGIFIDPTNQLVIAINSNWPSASDPSLSAAREELYRVIQQAIIE